MQQYYQVIGTCAIQNDKELIVVGSCDWWMAEQSFKMWATGCQN
jgi:hypothetical protein